MLVLGRELDETIVINNNIFIKVVKGKAGGIRLAIDAPRDVKVMRGELFPGIEEIEARWASSLKE